MAQAGISLRGVFTPIVTSFDEHGRIAHDKMAFNLDKFRFLQFGKSAMC